MLSSSGISEVKKLCVLICAYNEERYIEEVVLGALAQHPSAVIVVDDGSSDQTALLAEKAGAHVLSLSENSGKGGALRHGFEFVFNGDFDAVIVLDGDGQHDPSEIPQFISAYERTGIPVLIGNRMADTKQMPYFRCLTNRLFSRILHRLVRVYVADPPCGYRFYRTDVLPFILSDYNRFAFEFEMLLNAAKRRIRIDSVRISTIYNANKSNISPFRDGLWFIRCVFTHYRECKGMRDV